jgi:hypothetical protein
MKTKLFDSIENQVKARPVMDAEDGIFFARQLEHIYAKTADKKYADIKFREVFPISHEIPEGATSATVRSYDRTGTAKVISDYATDLPRSDIKGKEYPVFVKQVGSSYGYNTKEIRSAKLTGMPLEARRAAAAEEAHERKMNEIAFFGDADNGLLGLMTVGGIPYATVAAKAAGGTSFANGTSDEILFDMNHAVHTMRSTTLMKESPTRLLLPVMQYGIISTRRVSSQSDTTVLEYFLKTNGFINEVMPLNELDGAGVGGTDVMIIYNPDPDNLSYEIAMEPKHNAPELRGLEWQIACESETAGLLVRYPLSIAIWDGI